MRKHVIDEESVFRIPHWRDTQRGIRMAQSLELERGSELRLSRSSGRLIAIVEGRAVLVRLRQCFPWSDPNRHLSLRDEDDEEIALVEDPASLEPESRRALEEAVAEAGFVLEVVRVLSIEEEVEIRQWKVETKHGPR